LFRVGGVVGLLAHFVEGAGFGGYLVGAVVLVLELQSLDWESPDYAEGED
jgi:hypothetical protein